MVTLPAGSKGAHCLLLTCSNFEQEIQESCSGAWSPIVWPGGKLKVVDLSRFIALECKLDILFLFYITLLFCEKHPFFSS